MKTQGAHREEVAGRLASSAARGVAGTAAAQDLQQKLAAVKQAAAANQQALRSYTWLEKTELSLKGEVKATKVDRAATALTARSRRPPWSSRRRPRSSGA